MLHNDRGPGPLTFAAKKRLGRPEGHVKACSVLVTNTELEWRQSLSTTGSSAGANIEVIPTAKGAANSNPCVQVLCVQSYESYSNQGQHN